MTSVQKQRVDNGEILRTGTPVEIHALDGREISVKREDLCSPSPGPGFSKIRGLFSHLSRRPERLVGALDTYHSRAGWATAFCCKKLGKECVVFYPDYVKEQGPRENQLRARSLGAVILPLQAGRSFILYHRAKASLPDDGYMVPNALKLEESVEETAEEVLRTEIDSEASVIVPVSSGTLAAGVLRGLVRRGGSTTRHRIYLHLGYSRPIEPLRKYVFNRAGVREGDFRFVRFVDEGYQYRDSVSLEIPFPCDPYYDAKTWLWLERNLSAFDDGEQILFWNIG